MMQNLCRNRTPEMQDLDTRIKFLEMDKRCHPERYSIPDKAFAETLPKTAGDATDEYCR